MKSFVLISALFFVFGCNFNAKKINIVSEPDFKQAILGFSELEKVLKKDDGKLWNYKLDGPVLMINRETRVIIANEQDGKGDLTKLGDFFTGRFPEELNIANSTTEWNDKKWTMVAFPLPESKVERLDLLIHESFHRIQPLIGFDSLYEIQNTHLDTREGRIYLKLELEALKMALKSERPENHLKNALSFRKYRYQLFPDAKKSENSLEMNEGMAEYTGKILSRKSENKLKKFCLSGIEKFYQYPTFVRSFAYFTLPVYGDFMHQTNDKWNLEINKTSNLTDFILNFFKVKDSEVSKDEIMQIGKSYNIDSIVDFENKRELLRLDQINKYKARFLSDSILKIRFVEMNIGFNPGNLVPLDTFGTVYPNLRITDKWGILDVDSCGALLSPDWRSVTVTYPAIIGDSLLEGKGWKLKLNKNWKFQNENGIAVLTKK